MTAVIPLGCGLGFDRCCLWPQNDGKDSREFLRGGIPGDDAKNGFTHYSGMFPCLRGGSEARLLRSARSAVVTRARVSDGKITSSTYPRSQAT